MGWIDGIGNAITRVIGFSDGSVTSSTSYTSDLGWGQGLESLGGIDKGLEQLARDAAVLPTSATARQTKSEARSAGDWDAQAIKIKAIGDARKKKLRAYSSIMKTKIGVDKAAFQSASSVAQYQAQAIEEMATMDFHNQLIGAKMGGKVSGLRDAETIFNL